MPLVSTKEMLKKARLGGYAVGAFNADTAEIMQGIIEGAERANSPVIIAVTGRMLQDVPYLLPAVTAAASKTSIPVAYHLDHGKSVELCKQCVDAGFTSVMIDASAYDFETNIAMTSEVVFYAHSHGIPVEAELGALAGIEDDIIGSEGGLYTDPSTAKEFVTRTQIDSLAVAIGTSHGAYKFKPGQKPQLRFDILQRIEEQLPDFPLVLHGASSIPRERLDIFNQYGGQMPEAVGIPEDILKKVATTTGVCKINVCNDIRITYFGELRRCFAQKPSVYDAHQIFAPARSAVADLVYDKICNVLGSNNKA